MTRRTKARVLKCGAVLLDIASPLVAVISQFPIWVERSPGATVSGLFIVLALLCAVPAFKALTKHINTPGMPIVWTVIFVLLFALSRIIDEILVVCVVGIVSNLVGAGLYKIGDNIEGREKNG